MDIEFETDCLFETEKKVATYAIYCIMKLLVLSIFGIFETGKISYVLLFFFFGNIVAIYY